MSKVNIGVIENWTKEEQQEEEQEQEEKGIWGHKKIKIIEFRFKREDVSV